MSAQGWCKQGEQCKVKECSFRSAPYSKPVHSDSPCAPNENDLCEK
jgi:hypothetical protein